MFSISIELLGIEKPAKGRQAGARPQRLARRIGPFSSHPLKEFLHKSRIKVAVEVLAISSAV
ncbi:MAG TPA: hypothetical protein DCK93_02765 [Blastocatellia bacterium]|nr:hypothetical protein [Blastocatellia bacterium]